MNNNEYIHYFSVLKFLAMLAVICLHTFCTPVNFWNEYLNRSEIFIGVFISQFLLAWAVPIFLMVSGALFLDKSKNITLNKLYKKYILRLFLILLTFGTLYALMELVYTDKIINVKTVLTAVKNVYAGKSWDHMWFIYMIIGLYICTPPLRTFISKANESEILYLIIILSIFTWIIPFIDEITGITFGVYIPVKSIYLLYYILGYAIHNNILKINFPLSIILFLIGSMWCFLGLLIQNNIMSGLQLSILHLDFISVFLSVGIFSIAKNKCKSSVNWIDKKIVPLSLGIYVIHQVFLNIFFKLLHITPEYYSIWFCWFIVFSGTTIGSIIIVILFRKISFFNKWLF